MNSSKKRQNSTNLPAHVAIIMDGNGRWAKRRGLPRNTGHKKGAEAFENIVKHAVDLGIQHLTVYAFSTENFSRPKNEVEGIMDLMRSYLADRRKHENNKVQTIFLGTREGLAPDIVQSIQELEEKSKDNVGMVLNIAFNYGGKLEILQATQRLARDFKKGIISPEALEHMTEKQFEEYLYTAGQPSVDLVIRTSGEQRMSNFLLWQAAYAEFVFPEVLFPDFTPKHFDSALKEYATRERRIGGISAQT